MKLEWSKPENFRQKVICILFGTIVGTITYIIFLYLNLAIFGWNLGLAVAPLLAGYAETILAEKIMKTDTGAISAFILFVGTTCYSFILVNPSLGANFITFGSITVILQAAFPTLVNYILFGIIIGIVFYILRFIKRTIEKIYYILKAPIYKYILKKPLEVKTKKIVEYDEIKHNEEINSLDFIFMTSTDVSDKYLINVGQFQSTVIIEKDPELLDLDLKERELNTLNTLKQGKHECLINLTTKIKAAGGNGVIDLDIQYSLIGLGGESYQISAMGMGVYIK